MEFFANNKNLQQFQENSQAILRTFGCLQLKLHSRIGSQPYKTLRHPRFRAAYDFLLVRERASGDKSGIGKWWTDFQKNDDSLRGTIISEMNEKSDEESAKIFGFYNELR